ncbi:hypothetical protein [Xylophilus sp. GOD-11R]|uniref:hypothetical protein n=1 Tax=Xylophilus sp. GOD-11R TaxID=3089814 RepID=UPI00298D43A0|nr:hypothetical protein [Xylophilus sp. GOD-11R]WPB55347.1 hypothetical protein R9X41_14465 [Xylophilus sp. GOD-11R]
MSTAASSAQQTQPPYRLQVFENYEMAAEHDLVFPIQADEQAHDIPTWLENMVRLVTKTRREAGGYLLGRVIFDGEPQ